MTFKPTAFIIGAQKSGTTTLAHLLQKHPQICLSNPKETDFFTGNWDKGMSWYEGCYANRDANIILDASPSYSVAPAPRDANLGDGGSGISKIDKVTGVPARIHSINPDAKFIYILRDPIARTYSSYWHAVRAGVETKPWAEAVTLQSAYIRASLYFQQLQLYLEYFPMKSFLFINFKDLKENPKVVIDRCLLHIGGDLSRCPEIEATQKNASFRYNKLGHVLQNSVGGGQRLKYLSAIVKKYTPAKFQDGLRSLLTADIPKASDAQKALVCKFVEKDRNKIVKLVGFNPS